MSDSIKGEIGNAATQRYPGSGFFDSVTVGLLDVYSITFNSAITFLPYELKVTENLTPEWNQETVLGRMDPIAKFKRMGRTMNLNFKARAKQLIDNNGQGKSSQPYLPLDDLLHCIDHLKKLCYPRYDSNQVMTSPPLFRIRHDLIQAGEDTYSKGVLCFITNLKADPGMEKNSIFYKNEKTPNNKFGNAGNLDTAAYPNYFDVNLTFTVLNENLSNEQIEGVLKKRYFYNFVTTHGPAGGHTKVGEQSFSDTTSTPENLEKENANRNKVLKQ